MDNSKTSLTYIYSNQCDTATYLQFLIDKVRKIDGVNFIPICIEDYKKSPKAIKKLEDELEKKVKSKDYDKAVDDRAKLTRYKLSSKYANLSPVFIFAEGTEDEFIASGSKKSLSKVLDYGTRITDAVTLMQGVDFSGFEHTLKAIITAVGTAIENKNAGEGLETTQEQTSVT